MFVIKKKNIIIVSVLILTFFTFLVCFGALKSSNTGSAIVNKFTIVLDAGHGGIDGGVTGVNTSVKESELNLAIVKKLQALLEDSGMNVVLTRCTDAGLYGVASSSLKRKDMQKRRDIILKAKPTLVVSVHLNRFSAKSRRGAQVFYKDNDESAKILANSIQASFNGMEECVKTSSALVGDYYILNCNDYPSVIAECGFLSNPEDEALLITEEYQKSVAYAIFKGIVNYLTVR